VYRRGHATRCVRGPRPLHLVRRQQCQTVSRGRGPVNGRAPLAVLQGDEVQRDKMECGAIQSVSSGDRRSGGGGGGCRCRCLLMPPGALGCSSSPLTRGGELCRRRREVAGEGRRLNGTAGDTSMPRRCCGLTEDEAYRLVSQTDGWHDLSPSDACPRRHLEGDWFYSLGSSSPPPQLSSKQLGWNQPSGRRGFVADT